MKRHLYAFGSLCRGEFDRLSDIDLLACVESPDAGLAIDSKQFSVYTYSRLRTLWEEGNPFAWHLHLESKPLFSSDGTDFLADLGAPSTYRKVDADCAKFKSLLRASWSSLESEPDSHIFHLSCIFLATRNFATCHSFCLGRPNFSRLSPMQVIPPVPISKEAFELLIRARVLSTRGIGEALTKAEIASAAGTAPAIFDWMSSV
jgi:hypothetical protein